MFAPSNTTRHELFPREPRSWSSVEYSPPPPRGLQSLLHVSSVARLPSLHDSPTQAESYGVNSPVGDKPEPKKNASRERMKTELLALRVHVGCLETELNYLQQLARERLNMAADSDGNEIRNSREPSGGWQAMAERERVRRIRAEMQNRRLRATVEMQVDEWKNLQIQFDGQSQVLIDKIVREQVAPPSTDLSANTSNSNNSNTSLPSRWRDRRNHF